LSGISYGGLANGSYTFTVSLVSNGGGVQTSATRHFTVPVPNEIQGVRVSNATGGTFTLTFDGQTTAPIAFNATAAQLQAALEALSTIGPGNVSATGGDVDAARVDITFIGVYAGVDVAQLTPDATALTGTTPTVAISFIQQGGS
jgi:hypothetical protein